MKKIVMIVSALVLGTSAMAQTDQGGWMLGAGSNLGYSSVKQDNDQEDAENALSFNVRAGYFVIDHLAAGLDIGYNSTSQGDADASALGVGPYLRYFLMENKLFGELSYQFQTVSAGGENLGNGSAIGIGAGYAAWLNDNVTIEPMVKYSLLGFKAEGADEAVNGSGFGLMVNFGIYLGN